MEDIKNININVMPVAFIWHCRHSVHWHPKLLSDICLFRDVSPSRSSKLCFSMLARFFSFNFTFPKSFCSSMNNSEGRLKETALFHRLGAVFGPGRRPCLKRLKSENQRLLSCKNDVKHRDHTVYICGYILVGTCYMALRRWVYATYLSVHNTEPCTPTET